MDIERIVGSFWILLGGADETLLLVSSSVALGSLVALGLAAASLSRWPILAALAEGYMNAIRSTPLLVQIFLVYYGSGQFRETLDGLGLWTLFRDSWFCAIFALTFHTAAYIGVIMRGGVRGVPIEHIEAALAIGLSRRHMLFRVVLPIAIRQALPAYSNEVILMVKATALASTITIIEVTGYAKKLIAETFQPFEVFIAAGLIYLAINFAIMQSINLLERRLNRHLVVIDTPLARARRAAATHPSLPT